MGDPNEAKNVMIRDLTDEDRDMLRQLRVKLEAAYNNKALMKAGELYLLSLEKEETLQEEILTLNRKLDNLSSTLKELVDADQKKTDALTSARQLLSTTSDK